ncbi:hypothetical protein HPP92_001198 [Vanilla planifolia]|uniref:Uncharacterized protein n=1 Tax=Vanilla planifolia TaxID=51239 RepID=A0A835RZF7_VANPL|nr:hypothetical protein HPP92_001198 [Vanilla planifolia]
MVEEEAEGPIGVVEETCKDASLRRERLDPDPEGETEADPAGSSLRGRVRRIGAFVVPFAEIAAAAFVLEGDG